MNKIKELLNKVPKTVDPRGLTSLEIHQKTGYPIQDVDKKGEHLKKEGFIKIYNTINHKFFKLC